MSDQPSKREKKLVQSLEEATQGIQETLKPYTQKQQNII